MSLFGTRCRGWSFCLSLATILLLTGCQSTETFYRGYLAGNESVTPLTLPGSPAGHWQTFDIDLNYRYDASGNNLDISGTIDFGLFYELNTSRIERIDVYLFFLDHDSKVLETARLFRAITADPEETIAFKKNLQVPPSAKAIAFGYRGMAREDGGGRHSSEIGEGGGGTFFFDDLPKRPGN